MAIHLEQHFLYLQLLQFCTIALHRLPGTRKNPHLVSVDLLHTNFGFCGIFTQQDYLSNTV